MTMPFDISSRSFLTSHFRLQEWKTRAMGLRCHSLLATRVAPLLIHFDTPCSILSAKSQTGVPRRYQFLAPAQPLGPLLYLSPQHSRVILTLLRHRATAHITSSLGSHSSRRTSRASCVAWRFCTHASRRSCMLSRWTRQVGAAAAAGTEHACRG